jgi:hypothetical protein
MVWFGSSITKRVDGDLRIVDLRNYVTVPSEKDPQKRSHVEFSFLTYDEMYSHKKEWEEDWKSIEELWEKMRANGQNLFTVAEYWTWGEFGNDNKIHKGCIKYLDKSLLRPSDSQSAGDFDPYLELDRYITPFKKRRVSKRMRDTVGENEELFPY